MRISRGLFNHCSTCLVCCLMPYAAARPYPIALGKLRPPFTYPVLHKAAVSLSLAAAVLLLVKITPAFVALLGAQQLLSDALAPHLPGRVLSVLLTNTCADPELLCGTKLCTLVSAVQSKILQH
jgi:hypothetical protein